jgi:hypothetical protein
MVERRVSRLIGHRRAGYRYFAKLVAAVATSPRWLEVPKHNSPPREWAGFVRGERGHDGLRDRIHLPILRPFGVLHHSPIFRPVQSHRAVFISRYIDCPTYLSSPFWKSNVERGSNSV